MRNHAASHYCDQQRHRATPEPHKPSPRRSLPVPDPSSPTSPPSRVTLRDHASLFEPPPSAPPNSCSWGSSTCVAREESPSFSLQGPARHCEAAWHSRHLATDFVTWSACSAVLYVLPAAGSRSRLASALFPSEEEPDAVSSLLIDTPRARSPSTRTTAKDPARRSPSSQSSPLITAHAPHAVACKVAPH